MVAAPSSDNPLGSHLLLKLFTPSSKLHLSLSTCILALHMWLSGLRAHLHASNIAALLR